MRDRLLRFLASVVVAGAFAMPSLGTAETIQTHADGYQIVPTQNSPGTATFRAKVDRKARTISYELSWQDLKGDIIQSHIHFGRRATNGDIVVFLCTNAGNGPAGTPTCDGPRNGSVTHVAHEADIVAITFAGITPAQQLLPFADFDELANAIDAGATYIVVHTKAQPSGELRGQLPGKDEDEDHRGH